VPVQVAAGDGILSLAHGSLREWPWCSKAIVERELAPLYPSAATCGTTETALSRN
jgi:hypothetical protein